MSKNANDISEEILIDLRSNSDLVDLLPGGQDAIYESHPAEKTDEPVAIILWVVSDVSSPGRAVHEKSWRIQITVKASRPWRESQSSPGLRNMQYIMGHVHNVLDRMDDYHEVGHGSAGGTDPQELEGRYLAIANDWRITGHYAEPRYPSQQ